MQDKITDVYSQRDEISFNELINKLKAWYKYLMCRWILICTVSILGGVIGYFYAKFKKPVYTATTTFVLEGGDKGGLGQYSGLASMVGIGIGGGGGIFEGDNIFELYKSRIMIEKTLLTEVEFNGKQKQLVDLYADFNGLRKQWSEDSKLSSINFKSVSEGNFKFNRLQDSILGNIVNDVNKNYLKVEKPDKKLSIIRVDVKSGDEFFSRAFNEQIVKNVNDFYVQTKTKKSLENVMILQQKTDSLRTTMNGAIYTAAAVGDATPNLNPTRQAQRIAPQQRSQFSVETSKAMLSELLKNLELSKISLRKEAPLIQVIDTPIFPLEKNVFSKMKGLVLGAVISGILVCIFLLFQRIFRSN